MPKWVTMLLRAGTSFVITTGTALSTAMLATNDTGLPKAAVWLTAVLAGLIASARQIEGLLTTLNGGPKP